MKRLLFLISFLVPIGCIQPASGSTVYLGWAEGIIEACAAHNTKTVVTGYATVGPVAAALNNAQGDLDAAGIQLIPVRRDFDALAWPHATKGFFAMKKAVPKILTSLGFSL